MSANLSFLKSLLPPLLLSLLLYTLLTHLLLPLYRRHRRTTQYHPLSTLSTPTQNLRSTLSSVLITFLLPSRWAEHRYRSRVGSRRIVDARDEMECDREGEEEEDEEEELVGNAMLYRYTSSEDDSNTNTRAQQANLNPSPNTQARHLPESDSNSNRRLSRDLEQGFRDDSDSDDDSHLPIYTVRA